MNMSKKEKKTAIGGGVAPARRNFFTKKRSVSLQTSLRDYARFTI